jgi:hypothetical protein
MSPMHTILNTIKELQLALNLADLSTEEKAKIKLALENLISKVTVYV